MGFYYGNAIITKKFVYYYITKNSQHDHSYEIIDRETKEKLPLYISDDLNSVSFDDSCSFTLGWELGEMTEEQRKDVDLINKANDVLLDYVNMKDVIHVEFSPYKINFSLEAEAIYPMLFDEDGNVRDEVSYSHIKIERKIPKGFGNSFRVTRSFDDIE